MINEIVTREQALKILCEQASFTCIGLVAQNEYAELQKYIEPFVEKYYDRLFPDNTHLERVISETTGETIIIIENQSLKNKKQG